MKKTEPYVITIAHKKGGVGKTTIACNLSAELNKIYNTTVIDLDSQKQTTKFNNKRTNKFNIKDILDSKELISFLKQNQNLIIVDMGGYDSDLARTTLLLSDLIITPLSDTDNDLDGFVEFKNTVRELQNIQKDLKCNILVNRVHHRDKKTHLNLKKYISDFDNFDIFNTVLTNRKEYKRMLSSGNSVLENFKGTSKHELEELISEIVEMIK